MKSIVNAKWLNAHLDDPSVRVIDCRFELGKPNQGFDQYMENHISGAFYFDLEKDLSSPVGKHGGRHPLPNIERLVDKLSTAGIDSDTKIVAYDDQGGAMAARFWWLLKYLGHEQVYLLDGGFSKWLAHDYPTSNDIPSVERKEFRPNLQNQLLSNMNEVKQNLQTKKAYVLDSRDERRYAGLEEPIDRKAGHIPGALHYFWKNCIQDNNVWKTIDELTERFKAFNKDDGIIVYCGSGVTACPTIVALNDLGYQNVKLYIGSWSDWISYEDNPIALGKEE